MPLLSATVEGCMESGLDVMWGGSKYTNTGNSSIGHGNVADSLNIIDQVCFRNKIATPRELYDALMNNWEGYEDLKTACRNAPKYGNDDPFADKYAVWFVEFTNGVFSRYRTRDGGPFYTAIASNTQSVSAGKITGATPDGRHAGVPLSDAASPTYGMDKEGPTSAFLSLSRPDYRLVSCGTVVNQKYTPDMLTDPVKRAALLSAIKVYFSRGGQEVQINCVSRETLKDAMAHPENYADLVVRVSGFSAYFTSLGRDVQEDILHRTEHDRI
jgi:formate C-acetyltransferase